MSSPVIRNLIRREGGFVDNPADRGGPTKYGITLKTLSAYKGAECTKEDVRSLTEAEASEIYTKEYCAPFFVFSVYPDLFDLCVDSAVQHGVDRVRGWLDGIIKTTQDPDPIYKHLLRERIKFYGRLITKYLRDDDKDGIPDNTEFAEGWMNRIAEFVR